eukprot:m.309513 g.309513  ORF g.309513 m.309513 type:complete len:58 (+) comp46735_c0_seq1:498-671(+)
MLFMDLEMLDNMKHCILCLRLNMKALISIDWNISRPLTFTVCSLIKCNLQVTTGSSQ